MRLVVLVIASALVLAAPASAAPIRATLKTTTPAPTVDQAWRYTVKVTSATGMPLFARMKLQLLLGPTVVGCWKDGSMTQCFNPAEGEWITFRGKHAGVLRFPAESVGAKLTFQATVKADRQIRKLRAPLTVQPA